MADHAHTPLTDTVREVYSFAGAQAPSVRKQWFDRWLATVETAAEQRGAARGWDEGYAASDDEAYFFSTHGRTPNPYRADLMEGDVANQGDWCHAEHCPYRGTGKMPTHRRHEHCPVWRTND